MKLKRFSIPLAVLLSCTQFLGNTFAAQEKINKKSSVVKTGLKIASGILLAYAGCQNIDYYILKDNGVDKKYIKPMDNTWFKNRYWAKDCFDSAGKYYTWHKRYDSPKLCDDCRQNPMPIFLKGDHYARQDMDGNATSNIDQVLFMIDRPDEKYFIRRRYSIGLYGDYLQNADPFFVSPLKTITFNNNPFAPVKVYEVFDGEKWAKDTFNAKYDEVLYNFWKIYIECFDFKSGLGYDENKAEQIKKGKLQNLEESYSQGSHHFREFYRESNPVLNVNSLDIQKAKQMIDEFRKNNLVSHQK